VVGVKVVAAGACVVEEGEGSVEGAGTGGGVVSVAVGASGVVD